MTKIKVGDEVVYTGASVYLTTAGSDLITGSTGIVIKPLDFYKQYTVAFVGHGGVAIPEEDLRLKNDPEERRFLNALDMVEAKTGSPGLTSWSDGKVGMALSEFERLAGLLPTVKTGPFEIGETVYFLGYLDLAIVIKKFTRGDVLTINTVGEPGGGYVVSENGSCQWVRWDEISRTKP